MKVFRVQPINEAKGFSTKSEKLDTPTKDVRFGDKEGQEFPTPKKAGKMIESKKRVLDYTNLPEHLNKIKETSAFATWIEAKGIELQNAPESFGVMTEKKKSKKEDEEVEEVEESREERRARIRENIARRARINRIHEALAARRAEMEEENLNEDRSFRHSKNFREARMRRHVSESRRNLREDDDNMVECSECGSKIPVRKPRSRFSREERDLRESVRLRREARRARIQRLEDLREARLRRTAIRENAERRARILEARSRRSRRRD